jgi:hypothetical protein
MYLEPLGMFELTLNHINYHISQQNFGSKRPSKIPNKCPAVEKQISRREICSFKENYCYRTGGRVGGPEQIAILASDIHL